MPNNAVFHSPPPYVATASAFATTHVDVTLALAADHAALDCDLWEMALLSCARKHRSLLWYKYHRSVVRRSTLAATRKHQISSHVAAFPSQTSATSSSTAAIALSLQPFASVAAAPPPLTTAMEVSSHSTAVEPTALVPNETTKSTETTVKQPPFSESEAPPSPPPSSGSWRAMLVTLFAMISPEWGKEVRLSVVFGCKWRDGQASGRVTC